MLGPWRSDGGPRSASRSETSVCNSTRVRVWAMSNTLRAERDALLKSQQQLIDALRETNKILRDGLQHDTDLMAAAVIKAVERTWAAFDPPRSA